MLKKIVIGLAVFIGVVLLGGKLYIEYMDRQMDATPLVERLAVTPVPTDAFVLVDEWHYHGSWLIKKRDPEASRIYLTSGSVDGVCERLDDFYRLEGLSVREMSRSDDPPDWCGRTLRVDRRDLSIWVHLADSWWERPAEFPSDQPLVQVEYRAHR